MRCTHVPVTHRKSVSVLFVNILNNNNYNDGNDDNNTPREPDQKRFNLILFFSTVSYKGAIPLPSFHYLFFVFILRTTTATAAATTAAAAATTVINTSIIIIIRRRQRRRRQPSGPLNFSDHETVHYNT